MGRERLGSFDDLARGLAAPMPRGQGAEDARRRAGRRSRAWPDRPPGPRRRPAEALLTRGDLLRQPSIRWATRAPTSAAASPRRMRPAPCAARGYRASSGHSAVRRATSAVTRARNPRRTAFVAARSCATARAVSRVSTAPRTSGSTRLARSSARAAKNIATASAARAPRRADSSVAGARPDS